MDNRIGENIKYLLEVNGMSQRELARRLDKAENANHIGKWIKGEVIPRKGSLEDIEKVFHLPHGVLSNDDISTTYWIYQGAFAAISSAMDNIQKIANNSVNSALSSYEDSQKQIAELLSSQYSDDLTKGIILFACLLNNMGIKYDILSDDFENTYNQITEMLKRKYKKSRH